MWDLLLGSDFRQGSSEPRAPFQTADSRESRRSERALSHPSHPATGSPRHFPRSGPLKGWSSYPIPLATGAVKRNSQGSVSHLRSHPNLGGAGTGTCILNKLPKCVAGTVTSERPCPPSSTVGYAVHFGGFGFLHLLFLP